MRLEDLKKRFTEREEIKKLGKIVEKKEKERIREIGLESEEDTSRIMEEILISKTLSSRSVQGMEEHPSPIVRTLASVYRKIKLVVDSIVERIAKSDLLLKLDMDLYAANIPLTAGQYLSISVTAALLLSIIASIVVAATTVPGNALFGVSLSLLSFIATFIISLFFALRYPHNVAVSRFTEAEKELPYALRHMAVILRAGASIYSSLQSIAMTDYGKLSEEFRRTLNEIAQGKSTEEALNSLALRSKSQAIRRAVSQLVRSLRIGGRVSEVIMDIADDVAFEQRAKIAEFAEKMNLVGVIFMFVVVVFPTLVSILNGIGYAPVEGILSSFAMPLPTLLLFYFVLVPGFVLLIMWFVKKSDPTGRR